MTDKGSQLYAMIEDQRMTLEAELKDQLEMNEAGEKRAAAIRAELAELPVRPVKRRKAAKNGRKAKRSPGRKLADEVVAEDNRTVFEVARGIERPEPEA